ncbi:2,3-dimethylmalate lyase [Legionella massiliensis]|uniref:2,3-dimethylmalate lyase n=1 Tax=Legionella massiliensis TaxID=1034943 RepID=A0A078KTV3_9GAMM|nr:isocitrate lyase/phosphoenolpyruvate mutase family protein [Legionella massiliensis]CDZ76461.1 2,3-dimethylmalate lyase [Legionella massiliensis]CEE12199.1 2,3-dimethylmalate lyase [Legionella massiliensis]
MKGKLLRSLFADELVTAPGVFDGLSAKLATQEGFKAIYASGGAIARSTGRPDIGLLSLTEVAQRMQEIANATHLPVIADADTGFGNELNTVRTVQEFEQAGVAAIHLEDQTFPKRCGHLSGKTLIPKEEMGIKIRTAIKARSQTDFLIIARTDAIAVEGFSSAIERAKYYLEAGADMIFVEAPETVEQIEKIATLITEPKVINMFYGGKTPLVSSEELRQMGYSIAIIPSDLQRAAMKAMQQTLKAIQIHGDSSSVANTLLSFKEREEIIETDKFFKFVTTLESA